MEARQYEFWKSSFLLFRCSLAFKSQFCFQVQNIKFNSEIADVSANRRIVVMAFKEKLAAFDACNLVTKNYNFSPKVCIFN